MEKPEASTEVLIQSFREIERIVREIDERIEDLLAKGGLHTSH